MSRYSENQSFLTTVFILLIYTGSLPSNMMIALHIPYTSSLTGKWRIDKIATKLKKAHDVVSVNVSKALSTRNLGTENAQLLQKMPEMFNCMQVEVPNSNRNLLKLLIVCLH